MNYHAGAQADCRAKRRATGAGELWHLTSDRGQVRADGDDVQLNGNVRVTGPAPGSGEPLSLTTESHAHQHAHRVHRDRRAGVAALVGA